MEINDILIIMRQINDYKFLNGTIYNQNCEMHQLINTRC